MTFRRPSSANLSLIGRILNERYRVLCEIGRGGMGVVFEAEDIETLRPLAIKIVKPINQEGADLAARFQREAYVQSLLKHPNIAEGRHPARGVAASGFRPLCNIPCCCLP